jgi:hypothetical protein
VGWVRIEDGVYAHPKILRTPKPARWAWVAGMAYANAYLTDGHVPAEALRIFDATRPEARALAAAGLWLPVDGGWQIHDYGDYQATRAQVEAERATARARMARRRRNGKGEFA